MAKFKFYIIQIQSTKLNVLAGHIFVPGEECAAVAVILACAADFVVRLVCRKHSRRGIPRTSGSCPFSREGEVTGCSALDASACAKHACVNRIIHHGIRVTTLQGVKTGSTNLYLMRWEQVMTDEHLLLVPERRRHSRGGRLCPEERAPTRRVGTHDHARVVRTSYVSLIGRK